MLGALVEKYVKMQKKLYHSVLKNRKGVQQKKMGFKRPGIWIFFSERSKQNWHFFPILEYF